uniref:TSA: Wollemia nobilis Ref_Wollemi_Transcript_14432_1345 transcribed RNA sequence n=1 Tax=Wollemia nobilis TaxID=56998 RepID=A0A0C9RSW3_9CONI
MAAAKNKYNFFWNFLVILILLNCMVFGAIAHGGGSDDDKGENTEPHNLRARGLIEVKIWSLIIIFVATFAGGISPYFCPWNDTFLVLGTQFAGGVFLGTALMHFLSDSNETFESLTEKAYPFAFMLCSAGYLVTMLGDCVIIWVYRGKDKGVVDVEKKEEEDEEQCRQGWQGLSSKTVSAGDSVMLILALCIHSVFEGIAIGVAETEADAWKALWTVGLHKIFAAIAMGIALLRMIPDRPLLSCAAYAFAFAVSSPIGVGIGIAIDATTEGHVADWIYAISMGLATGVFIYVAVNHLLAKGYAAHAHHDQVATADKPFFKLLAVTLGVGVIAVVMIWDT